MLSFLTIFFMIGVGYAFLREGIFTAFLMCCNVILSGLIAFNFWEPLARPLEESLPALAGYEDVIILVGLFSAALGILRTATNFMSRTQVRFPSLFQQIGGAVFGALTAYLVCGFLICVMQTLPWHENFMGFSPRVDESSFRRIFPPDRVWLAMMHRAGAYTFANIEDLRPPGKQASSNRFFNQYNTFDKPGSFELRFARYRRYNDHRGPMKYVPGEVDQ
jgi:hypothetical protein